MSATSSSPPINTVISPPMSTQQSHAAPVPSSRERSGTVVAPVALLKVMVVEGRSIPLAKKAPNALSYVAITYENQGVRLPMVIHAGEPKWNAEHSFDVTSEESEVVVQLYHEKKGGKGEFIGRVAINISTLKDYQSLWYPLLGKNNEKAKGELHIIIKCMRTGDAEVSYQDFDLLKLGKGTFGKVLQVKKKDTGRIYAMKVMKKKAIVDNNEVEHILSEKQILQHMDCSFIVGLKFAFQTVDKLFLVMDFINGGELFYHLQQERRFKEDRARFYAAEILLALEYLHKRDIIYRDLKPENVLLNMDGHVCLTDFGLCKEGIGMNQSTHTFCGTPEYLAPEVLHSDGRGYGRAVDWWSLGTLLYEMLCGIPPFYSQNVQDMYKRILHAPLHLPPHLSHDASELLKGMLQRDPRERLGSGVLDAEEIKCHPFFMSVDWSRMSERELDPPFKPQVSDAADTGNFAVGEQIGETVVVPSIINTVQDMDHHFRAFDSYEKKDGDDVDDDMAMSMLEATDSLSMMKIERTNSDPTV